MAIRLFEPVDAGDMRVVERGKDFGLALEAGEAIGIRREVGGQGLDSDLPIESGIGGEVHHTHAATAEFALNLEWADGVWVHEGGVYGSEGSPCPTRPHRGQRTEYAGLPHPNALQEGFYWCTFTPTCLRVLLFDEHIEGLSRSGHGTCAAHGAGLAILGRDG